MNHFIQTVRHIVGNSKYMECTKEIGDHLSRAAGVDPLHGIGVVVSRRSPPNRETGASFGGDQLILEICERDGEWFIVCGCWRSFLAGWGGGGRHRGDVRQTKREVPRLVDVSRY